MTAGPRALLNVGRVSRIIWWVVSRYKKGRRLRTLSYHRCELCGSDKTKLDKLLSRPYVVNWRWLYDSYIAATSLPESEYLIASAGSTTSGAAPAADAVKVKRAMSIASSDDTKVKLRSSLPTEDLFSSLGSLYTPPPVSKY